MFKSVHFLTVLKFSFAAWVATASFVDAHALRYVLFGSVDFASPKVTGDGTKFPSHPKYSFGGGVRFEIPLHKKHVWQLDIGGIYQRRSFTVSGITEDEYLTTGLMLPVGLRGWVSKVFSIGFGGQLTQGIGPLQKTTAGVTRRTTYEESGLNSWDWGLYVAGGLNIGLGKAKKVSLFAEVHYQFGIFDAASGSLDTWKYNDLMVLLGIRFGGVQRGGGGSSASSFRR